jgi:hypothetical protein
MEINITQLVAHFLPPQYQAYFFLLMFFVYVAFNAVAPFLKNYKFNGFEHMIWLALTELRVDKDTKQVTFELPAEDLPVKQSATAITNTQEVTQNEPIQQNDARQFDPSLTL